MWCTRSRGGALYAPPTPRDTSECTLQRCSWAGPHQKWSEWGHKSLASTRMHSAYPLICTHTHTQANAHTLTHTHSQDLNTKSLTLCATGRLCVCVGLLNWLDCVRFKLVSRGPAGGTIRRRDAELYGDDDDDGTHNTHTHGHARTLQHTHLHTHTCREMGHNRTFSSICTHAHSTRSRLTAADTRTYCPHGCGAPPTSILF